MKKFIYGIVSFSPVLALAQSVNTTALDQIVAFFARTVRALIPIMFGLAIVYFFWGLIQYIKSAGDPVAAGKGKSIMIYGAIAIAVMLSIYGIAFWLQGLFGISNIGTVTPPSVGGL